MNRLFDGLDGGPNPEKVPNPASGFYVPLPGLAAPMGLGDMIGNALAVVGVQPCTPCEARKQALNRLQFGPWGGL